MPETRPLLRSFIAIPLPAPLRQRIAVLQLQLRQLAPQLNPVKVKNLHLTLHFLGDQPQQLLAKIGQVMLSIGQKKRDFNVTLKGLGYFPERRRPQVLWLGIEPEKELSDLYRQLSVDLNKLGLTTEQRRYRPHLTLGRFRQTPKAIDPLCPFLSHSCGNLKIDRMILYTSELTTQGALHTPLTTAPLTGTKP